MHAIHNARVQLLATALNNLALAVIVAGFFAPAIGGQMLGSARVAVGLAWIGFGLALHATGQVILGRLRP